MCARKTNPNIDASLTDEFLWYRDEKEAYSIIEGQPISTDLVPLTRETRNKPFLIQARGLVKQEEYSPSSSNPFLYRDFAKLKFNENDVLEFTKQYGLLGVEERFETGSEAKQDVFQGEPIALWFKAIRDIGNAIELWDRCLDESLGELPDRLEWKYNGEECVLMDIWQHPNAKSADSELIVDSRADALLAKQVANLSPREQAQFTVNTKINRYFYKHTSAHISLNATAQKPPTIKVRPNNLLGWLWLQLANEVTRETVYFECLNCGKRVVKKVTRGQPSKTCSASCRVQISQRKAKAASEG